ncbi:MFS transporter [Solemya pervernicosa gill symbiont]|uniref:MFS transporter n=2 Tax=Gammaproteobacteria incertae sedis TaxID=118884 RepID=A0A1T2L8P5_9GAMM|nr:efflux RND transporter permease subunit [Candidatus Reidiella endopervernicosa]OOZ41477.1 MFS transporter [Solemya pervernicosa gill symbiont]QKQ27325.1 efflux RND transporter permease subunit [Candidatus Reidiella endopervernicosa]
MKSVIEAAFDRSRIVILVLLFVLLAGSLSWQAIPKEADPDVTIPIVYVSMSHEGISPEDAERLLVRPMEKELQSIEGIKEMTSSAAEGHASVTLEFEASVDNQRALDDVREKVDIAKIELPNDTDEPEVHEVNVALFPVLTVALSGTVPEAGMLRIARELKDRIESLPQVLEADIGGDREDLLEIIVDPQVMESYDIRFSEVFELISNNNLLVAAGALDTGAGRMVVKVPGVIEDLNDILKMPVKVANNNVVVFEDVASIRLTFKDPEGFARVGSQSAITLEIKKRVGANIIQTIEKVREIVAAEQKHWPETLQVAYLQDKSGEIKDMLNDLTNNVMSAIVLVMIVILAILGARSALLVGMAIPASFLAGIFILYNLGYTLNIVVLFSLILVVGMLVDGAIVVSELADRRLAEGMRAHEAYAGASKRMSWPIIASTATTLAVFLPLMFWPGVIGEFMGYLPLTVIICLSASLIMALVFIPVLGGVTTPHNEERQIRKNPEGRMTQIYAELLAKLLRHPGKVLLVALMAMIGSYTAYGTHGHGVEFFPDVEPEFAQVHIRARGDLSIHEKDALVREVESRILDMKSLKSVYARSFNNSSGENRAEDVVGVIQLQFTNWQHRPKASVIMDRIRERTADISGIIIEVRKQAGGPGGEKKPVQIQLSSREPARLAGVAKQLRAVIDEVGGFVDVEDNRPLPGIEWRLEVDREKAARYGANVQMIGNTVQMITNGIRIAGYRPDDSDDEVDIRVRYPFVERNLDHLSDLRVATANGMQPITNFVTLIPAAKTGTLSRADARRVITVQADVAEGVLLDERVQLVKQQLEKNPLDPEVKITFKGEDADQREAATFLSNAFMMAIFLMVVILVTQFNSIYQALLVLSAIIFSTAGVLLGLLLTAQPFGVVMVGIGIIALAGIVVNNNIVLIDTYNGYRRDGMSIYDAALKTGRVRLRPVLLTAITTVLGLMPMVFALNIDLIERTITFGAPSTQWWTQLSTAIAGGLTFATLLTLILTPCLLVLGEQSSARIKALFLRIARMMGHQPTTE